VIALRPLASFPTSQTFLLMHAFPSQTARALSQLEPAQHSCPGSPHGSQVVELQVAPGLQLEPPQQGWPARPQATQELF